MRLLNVLILSSLSVCESSAGTSSNATIPDLLDNESALPLVSKHNLADFLGKTSQVRFYRENSTSPSDANPASIIALIGRDKGHSIYLATLSYEGGPAEISEVFIHETAGLKNLIVVAKWRVSHPGLGIDGFSYKLYAFKEKILKGNGFSYAEPNDSLMEVLGGGFDGRTEEGTMATYPFKSSKEISARLSMNSKAASESECLRQILHSVKVKQPELGCALRIAGQMSSGAPKISSATVAVFNDLGFYLAESGRYEDARKILEPVVVAAPARTVAYLNLADAYWGLRDSVKAKAEYRIYKQRMESEGKAAKIPKHVLERTSK